MTQCLQELMIPQRLCHLGEQSHSILIASDSVPGILAHCYSPGSHVRLFCTRCFPYEVSHGSTGRRESMNRIRCEPLTLSSWVLSVQNWLVCPSLPSK